VSGRVPKSRTFTKHNGLSRMKKVFNYAFVIFMYTSVVLGTLRVCVRLDADESVSISL
jgi:hypothetical protein